MMLINVAFAFRYGQDQHAVRHVRQDSNTSPVSILYQDNVLDFLHAVYLHLEASFGSVAFKLRIRAGSTWFTLPPFAFVRSALASSSESHSFASTTTTSSKISEQLFSEGLNALSRHPALHSTSFLVYEPDNKLVLVYEPDRQLVLCVLLWDTCHQMRFAMWLAPSSNQAATLFGMLSREDQLKPKFIACIVAKLGAEAMRFVYSTGDSHASKRNEFAFQVLEELGRSGQCWHASATDELERWNLLEDNNVMYALLGVTNITSDYKLWRCIQACKQPVHIQVARRLCQVLEPCSSELIQFLSACQVLTRTLNAFPQLLDDAAALWVVSNPDLLRLVLTCSNDVHFDKWPTRVLEQAYNMLSFVMKWATDKNFPCERSVFFGTDVIVTAAAVRAQPQRYTTLSLAMRSSLIVAHAALDGFLKVSDFCTTPKNLSVFPSSVMNDSDFASRCVRKFRSSVFMVIEPSRDLVMTAIHNTPYYDRHDLVGVAKLLYDDSTEGKKFALDCLCFLEWSGDVLNSWPASYFKDKSFVAPVALHCPENLQRFSPAVRDNSASMLEAFKLVRTGWCASKAWQALSGRLKGDKTFVLDVLRNSHSWNATQHNVNVLERIAPELARDDEVVDAVLRLYPCNTWFASLRHQTKQRVLDCLDCLAKAAQPSLLGAFHRKWRRDRDVVTYCLTYQPLDYEFVYGDLRYDVELAKLAVKNVQRDRIQVLRRFIPQSVQRHMWPLIRAKLQ